MSFGLSQMKNITLARKKNNEIEGYVRLETKGKVKIIPHIYWHFIISELNHLELSTSWNVLGSPKGNSPGKTVAKKEWYNSGYHGYKDVLATVKIFSN